MLRCSSRILRVVQFLSVALAVASASAQDYPSRPVRVVIPFSPGGSNDIIGRYVSDQLSKRLGAPFVVDNRGGAGGTMGTDIVAKAKPDGYTLLLISTPHTANSTLYKKLAYNPVTDFAPIARLGTAQQVISVYPGLPVKTLPEFIAYAKARPGQLNYVSSGVGSSQHLVTEMFTHLAGLKLMHVPYKGAGAALADVAAGHAQLSIGTVTQALPLLRGERMRPLAVSGAKRQTVVPDVPTASEVGLNGFDADNWWGFLAPAGTSPEIIQKLSTVLADILSKPETIKKLAEESATVAYMPPDAFAKFMETETVKWAKLIQQLKLQAE